MKSFGMLGASWRPGIPIFVFKQDGSAKFSGKVFANYNILLFPY
jgi:hypothetical protein